MPNLFLVLQLKTRTPEEIEPLWCEEIDEIDSATITWGPVSDGEKTSSCGAK
jgi:hypothetical protein